MEIHEALSQRRFETARRLALAELVRTGAPATDLLLALHQAYRGLGDIRAAQHTLGRMAADTVARRFNVLLWSAEDTHQLMGMDFYRSSAEAAAGLTFEEYEKKLTTQVQEYYAQAETAAVSMEQRHRLAESLQRTGRSAAAANFAEVAPEQSASAVAAGASAMESVFKSER